MNNWYVTSMNGWYVAGPFGEAEANAEADRREDATGSEYDVVQGVDKALGAPEVV